ncbi:MAG: hypothetical protein ACSW8D_01095 [Prevotella sp.]
MIVDSMTHEEVYKELEREREAVTRWWRHQLTDQRRRALKCTRFPMRIWKEYTSPRKNRYVFFSRVFDKHMKRILTGIGAIRRGNDGLTVYTNWLSGQKFIAPMVLTPHFWKRYAERCHVDKYGTELVKRYFSNNPFGKDSDNQKVVARSVRYNGEDHLSNCVTDGVLLGQMQDGLFIVRTFITYDMTCGLQQQEFEAKRGEILTDEELYKQVKKHYL